jgi:plasmid stabilization system protein ParE
MRQAFWTSIAEAELREIIRYIRVEGQRPETVRRLAYEIRDAVDDHARRDMPGSRHPAIPDGWLYVKFKRWLIVYVATDKELIVQRIVDAARDLPTLFSEA